MNWKLLPLGICVWALVLGLDDGARAQTTTPETGSTAPGIASISVKEAQPGQAVSVTLKNVVKGASAKVVLLGAVETNVGTLTVPEDKTITFNVPAGLPLGNLPCARGSRG